MDQNGSGVARLFETDVLPCLAGVRRLVNTLPDDDVASKTVRSGGNVDDVRIRIRNANGADGSCREVTVGNRELVIAIVDALEDATAGRSQVERRRLVFVAGNSGNPTSPRRANHSIAESREEIGRVSLRSDEPGRG